MKLSWLGLTRTVLLLYLTAVLVLLLLNSSSIAFAVVAGAALLVFFLVRYHARITSFICPECQQPFPVSSWIDFISPHTCDRKWLRCPSCHRENWCLMDQA